MMRRETLVKHFAPNPVAPAFALASVAAVVLLLLVLPFGCTRSPYRRALESMDRAPSTRLAEIVRRAAEAQRSALLQMETARTLLVHSQSPGSSDSDWMRLEDAVQLSRWWSFNSTRLVESVADALGELEATRPEAQSSLTGAEGGGALPTSVIVMHCGEVLTLLRGAAGLLDQAAQDLEVALGALAPEARSAQGRTAHEASAPDLAPVRHAVESAAGPAAAFVRLLRETRAEVEENGES